MKIQPFTSVVMMLAALSAGSASPRHRGLTFAERVVAQRAIEEVYYSHQIAANKPFEEAVPEALLEAKVRRALKLSVALRSFWHTPITAEMLGQEADRISRDTRMPDRLGVLFAALGHEPILFQ